MKKLLALIMALAMVLSMVPAVFAADDYDRLNYDTALSVGSNQLTLGEQNLFIFSPEETGVYTCSVSGGASIGYWSTPIFLIPPAATSTSVEVTCSGIGQQFVLGIQSEDPSVTLTIAKTGEVQQEVVAPNWEKKHTPNSANVLPKGAPLTEVNIREPHTAVKGADGFYYLDSTSGEKLYVEMQGSFSLVELFQAPSNLSSQYDGTTYRFKSVLEEYAAVMGSGMYYPLTEDLYAFLVGYVPKELIPGGWVTAPGASDDMAWMTLCYYGEPAAPTDPTDPTEPSQPQEPLMEVLVLEVGENVKTLVPGTTYILRVDLGSHEPAGTLTWTGDVSVADSGSSITEYDLANYSMRAQLTATVTTQTQVTFTITLPEEKPVPQLALGANAIEVADGYNGSEATFIAPEAGSYTLSAAEGESNAFVMILNDYGSETVDLPYTFTLDAGGIKNFVIATDNANPDTIDLVLAKSEPIQETLVLEIGENVKTLVPGTTYILRVDLGSHEPAGTLTWTGGVTVTDSGNPITEYDLAKYSMRAQLSASVTAQTQVTFTITLPEEKPAPQLALGANAIEVADGYNGIEASFTAPEAGEYILSAAEGESNAFVILVGEYSSEAVDLPCTFTLSAGATQSFVIATDNTNPDTIDLVLEKAPAKPGFSDVKPDAYYADAVMWAVESGITAGTSDTTFSPNNACTRGQVVMFLWRANGSPAPRMTENPFLDVKTTDYFYEAVLWAVENNITAGVSENEFGPRQEVTRAQFVTFLWSAMNHPDTNRANPFNDVPDGRYYTKPILWALENGITSGVSATEFGTQRVCERSHVVTFLYSAYGK